MVKQNQWSRWAIAGGLIILSLVVWLGVMREFRLDDSFITYRYARNMVRGWGLVYNQSDFVLSTTAPLYALLLAALSLVLNDFPVLGGLLGTLSIGIGAGLIVELLPSRMPLAIRIWGGVVYALSTPLWLALGMETPLWIMLVLAAVWLGQMSQWGLSGGVIGLAMLVRLDATLPGLLLGVAALGASVNALGTRRHWWQPVINFSIWALLPFTIFGVWAWLTYGSPIPATLAAKHAQATLGITGFGPFVDVWGGLRLIVDSLLAQSPLYLMLGPLLLLGLRGQLTAPIILIVGWGVLHLMSYAILDVAPYRWYYVPLLPGVVLLAAYGVERVWRVLRQRFGNTLRYAVVVVAVMPLLASLMSFARISDYFVRTSAPQGDGREVMLPIVDWQAYRAAGEWLNLNTPPDAVVGVAEVGQLGFYADRWMTDYLGLLQPDVTALLRRNDLYSWLVGYAPDYLVFQRFGGQVGLALYNYFIEYDPWFVASYREVAKFDDPRYVLGPVVIYGRTTPERQIITQPTDADFGPLRLVGVGVEDGVTGQGGPVRVRLDWRATGENGWDGLPPDVHITLEVVTTGTAQAPDEPKFDGDYQTRDWPERLSTWHSLMLPNGIPPGRYPLQVTVGIIDGVYQPAKVGWLDIPRPAWLRQAHRPPP